MGARHFGYSFRPSLLGDLRNQRVYSRLYHACDHVSHAGLSVLTGSQRSAHPACCCSAPTGALHLRLGSGLCPRHCWTRGGSARGRLWQVDAPRQAGIPAGALSPPSLVMGSSGSLLRLPQTLGGPPLRVERDPVPTGCPAAGETAATGVLRAVGDGASSGPSNAGGGWRLTLEEEGWQRWQWRGHEVNWLSAGGGVRQALPSGWHAG